MTTRESNWRNWCLNEEGLSLISTLWIVTILSILATQLLYSIHLEQRAQRNFLERAKYHYAAKAGFEWTLAVLRGDLTPFDSLGEDWAAPREGQVEDGIQLGNLLVYRVAVTDESAKININTADPELIVNLLALAGAEPDDTFTQELANQIHEGQPYRTVRALARIEGMTEELLYGNLQSADGTSLPSGRGTLPAATEQRGGAPLAQTTTLGTQAAPPATGLVHLATVYSIDANTDANGEARVNVNTADAGQLTGVRMKNEQQIFSQAEAESLIQQREFEQIAELVDVQAVSDELFNNIRDRITTEGGEGGNQEEENAAEEKEEQPGSEQVNINTADVEELQSLDGIDEGIAERIVNHRDTQGTFQNVDAIKEVKLLTQEEFVNIVDKVTLKDDETLSGLINVNTASPETMALLPGMDAEKAQAITARREETPSDSQQAQDLAEQGIEGNPFTAISQLMEVQEIDFETFREVVDWVTYRSHAYRIEASGTDLNNKVVATCVGIIDRSRDSVTVQYWRQD